MRCGFASYFGDGWEDHWVCEYRHDGTWHLADAQLDAVMCRHLGVDFDAADLPRHVFLTAGEAWLLCRAGQEDPQRFGHGASTGLWFVGVNVVRDALTMGNRETSVWDGWRAASLEQRWFGARDLQELDRLAGDPDSRPHLATPSWQEMAS